MRPEFGCGIHDYVFESIDAYTLGRIDYEIRVALDRWEPRIDVVDVDFDTSEAERGMLVIDITYSLRAHQPRAQPRLSRSTSSRRGPKSEHPADRARRPALPGPRQRGPHARRPGLPGVDRAQRLGPGNHADRAVRVDDRDARLPAQPRSRTSCSSRCSSCSGSRSPSPCGHDRGALPPLGARGRSGRDPRRRRPRSARCARPATSRSSSRRATTSRSRRRGRWPTSSSEPARPRTSASARAWRARRAPTSWPSSSRRRSATRSTSASTRRSRACCCASTSTARRPAAPAWIRRIRRCASRSPTSSPRASWSEATVLSDLTGGFNYGSGAIELQLPSRHSPSTDRGAAGVLGALPPRRRHALGQEERGLHACARDLRHHGRRRSAP